MKNVLPPKNRPRYRRILQHMQPEKAHVLLSYIFNAENLEVWMKDEWCKLLDMDYVEREIIGVVSALIPQAESLCDELYTKAYGMFLIVLYLVFLPIALWRTFAEADVHSTV